MSEGSSVPRKPRLGLYIFISVLLLLALLVYFFWPHYQIVDVKDSPFTYKSFSTEFIENTGRSSLYCFGIMVSAATEQKTTAAHTVDGFLPRFTFFPNDGWQLVKEKVVDGHILSVYYYDTALRPGETSTPILDDIDANGFEEFKGWKENNYGCMFHCFPSILSAVANPEQMADWMLGHYKKINFK